MGLCLDGRCEMRSGNVVLVSIGIVGLERLARSDAWV